MLNLNELRSAVRYEGGVSRRLLLAYGASLASLPTLSRASRAESTPNLSGNPFTLGVASGDPDSQGVVLWTRLAPEPFAPDGGMPAVPVEVHWEVADDEGLTKNVVSGVELATPQLGHSVHVEMKGLRPDRWYWYRFRVGDAVSPVARTRTLPEAAALPARVRFGVTSCQNFEQGLFTAYEQMARDENDLVLHLGDYIYEYASGRNGKVRTHIGKEIESLGEYRVRHSQYRSDPLLQAMHAQCPWIVTWDDHEFDNNCAGAISEETFVDPVDFLIRRANAYQAYYEMMPLRRRSMPTGPDMRLYRKSSYGRLAELLVLDTRQYRTDQPNGDKRSILNEAALDRQATMLGGAQRNWLSRALIESQSVWNVLAQQVMMGMVGFSKDTEPQVYSMDQWPGYAYERMELMRFIAERKVPNPVVLTGDIHSNWANELRVDDREHDSKVVATEFVATSLSSGGNGVDKPATLDKMLSENPCVKFHNQQRGYIRCTVTPNTWTSDYVVVDKVTEPGGTISTRATFVVESGDPQIKPA